MLDDTERKLLRIMCHFSNHYRRMPALAELMRLSGRKRAGVIAGCRELVREEYIQWLQAQPVETAVILLAWEKHESWPQFSGNGGGHWRD
ncbi:hypothetical protein [Paenibacillus sp. HW567]|uniref:hypothetical protein n=1 Tax=Paenibacillus sp. HW567 TaxID=1034769 RepID=UPI000366163F|nr:hypothetical protein [Paenibacillus sp. HW567]